MITALQKGISLVLVFLIMNFASWTKGNEDENIKKIGDNIANGLISGAVSPFAYPDVIDADSIVSRIATDEEGDCYFSDIDYQNGDRTTWPLVNHIKRAEILAIRYRNEKDEIKKSSYRDYILKLIDYWIKKDFQNSNWWHNKLSNTNILGELGILMKDDLEGDRLYKLSEMVGRGSFTVDVTLYAYTGSNAIDLAMSTIKFGVLAGSRNAVETAVRIVSKELNYSAGEGLKKDGTFFQHGNRIYMGGYGIDFINGMSKIICNLTGTKYMFSKDKLMPFANFIADGMKTMSFGNILDPTTMGRSVSRYNAQPLPSIVSSLVQLSNTPEMPRKDEIAQYALSIHNNTKSDNGMKYFDKAKFLVINNSDFYFSFRGGDNTLYYSEKINDENILGYNSSYPGVTTIMHTGNEYVNISPLFDYSLVPGTTAVYETDEELLKHSDFTYRSLIGKYGSTVNDNDAVVFASATHEKISMKISCFATDNAVLLMGAGMKDSAGRKMNTTVDQSYYTGSYSFKGNTVIHNGIKYTVLEGGKVTAENRHSTGSWRRNNTTQPNVPVEGDIFTISIENTGSYAYTVMSEKTDEKFEIIVNNESIQAVKMPDGKIAAAFYTKGKFDFEGKTYSGKAGKSYIY